MLERFGRQRAFVYVRRQVSPDQARRVKALELEGIGFMKESRRFYPNRDLAAHLLGYVGIDNTGLDGIEPAYDSLIKGRPGTVLIQTDARRHAFSRLEKPPINTQLRSCADQTPYAPRRSIPQAEFFYSRNLEAAVFQVVPGMFCLGGLGLQEVLMVVDGCCGECPVNSAAA
jgi:hypothetical protein